MLILYDLLENHVEPGAQQSEENALAESVKLTVEKKMEEIKGIISKEENAVSDFVNVSNKLLSKDNAILSANDKNTIGSLKEAYGKLKPPWLNKN